MSNKVFRKQYDNSDRDELFDEAVKYVIEVGKASASLLQRRLSTGYARAARIIDQLERAGIISEGSGATPREVIIESFDEYQRRAIQGVTPSDEEEESKYEIEWSPSEVDVPILRKLQQTNSGSNSITIPVGFRNNAVVTEALRQLGHIYIHNSALSGCYGLLRTQLDFLTKTYSPDNLRLIIMGDNRALNTTNYNSHLVTPISTDLDKVVYALNWALHEVEMRQKLFEETGVSSIEEYKLKSEVAMHSILFVIHFASDMLSFIEEARSSIEKLLGIGNSVGIHVELAAPMMTKKMATLFTSFPTKFVFKTYSVIQSEYLGSKEYLALNSPSEFFFVPPFGKAVKLTSSPSQI